MTVRFRLIGGEDVVPESFEVLAQLAETFDLDAIDASRALRASSNEPGTLEHLEVLRDRGPRDVQPVGELSHRLSPSPQALEDRTPSRIRECRDRSFVSHD